MRKPFLLYLIVALCLLFVSCAPIKPTIYLPERTVNNLDFLYNHVPTEFAFCVFGYASGQNIKIDHIELPYITEATKNRVSWFPCDNPLLPGAPQFLGIGHSHPPGSLCEFSDTDINALLKTNAPYGFLVCEKQELVWYKKSTVRKEVEKQGGDK